MQLEKDQVLAGRYCLERAVGKGGMGQVWVARHLQLDTLVAVKFMAASFAAQPQMRARFEREAKAAALLKSPNAVQVHDYGIEDGTPYIVMELLEGEDLQARIKREGRLTPAATAKIVVQLCRALRRAHEEGLVHRDLKPANVFMARNGDEEVVKILDFGIVKATGAVLPGLRTNGHLLMGSPQFMAPEQVFDHRGVDHRADLWSLAVMTFRCLVGRLPFPSKNHVDLIMEISSLPVPPAGLGRDVDRFFARALARDPAARFQSALELAEAFVGMDWSPEESLAQGSLVNTPAIVVTPLVEDPQDAVTVVRSAGVQPTVNAFGRRGGTLMLWPQPPAIRGLADRASGGPDSPAASSGAVVLQGGVARRLRRSRRWTATLVAAAGLVLGLAMLSVQVAPAGVESSVQGTRPFQAMASEGNGTSASAMVELQGAAPVRSAEVPAGAVKAKPATRTAGVKKRADGEDPYAEDEAADPYAE